MIGSVAKNGRSPRTAGKLLRAADLGVPALARTNRVSERVHRDPEVTGAIFIKGDGEAPRCFGKILSAPTTSRDVHTHRWSGISDGQIRAILGGSPIVAF